ncbi:MAG: hypothetical protein QOD92_3437 [Acidimicrobiaceae bacterium]|jgi:hypothetical protein
MRILQLDLGGQRIEFHPYVTVLRGLDDGLRAKLIDALSAVSAGRPSVEGLVEAHGVVLDLTDATLKLLDLQGAAAGGFDIIVRREQLPGNSVSGSGGRGQIERARADAADRVARAEADIDRAAVALQASRDAASESSGGTSLDAPRAELARLAARRTELEAAAEQARQALAQAHEAQTVADERVDQARALRTESARACSVAAGALESARGVRDPFAATALDAARERLALLEAADSGRPRSPASPAADDGFDDPDAELATLEGRRLELEAALLALDTVDPFPVQVSLTQLASADDEGELVASEEAIRLADEIARVGQPAGVDEVSESASGSAIAVARRRLDAARAAVFDAERAVRLPEVDRLDIEGLENAHEQVLIAQDRSDKRLSGARAKQRLDEVREVEQEILNRLGFVTYTEFVMGTSMLNVDPEREKRLEIARSELASAEDALADLEADVDAELARAELVARRRSLSSKAIALLGRDPGDDVEWALRHHRVRVQDGTDRAGRLQEALESAGVMIGDEEMPPALLVEIAKIWLDEQSETSSRRDALAQEMAELEARLSLVGEAARIRREAPSAEDVEDEANERAARRQAQLEEARSVVLTAELRLARQAQIGDDIVERKAELEAATRAEEAVATALAAAEVEAAAAADAEQAAAAERTQREHELAAAVHAERQAAETLAELTSRLSQAASSADAGEFERAVADAQAAVDQASAALESGRRELALIDAQLADLDGNGSGSLLPGTAMANVEELEWYLLSRVAAQRSVSYAGSVPLVLDDALAGVQGTDLVHLLSRLERMSTAVQVIVVSEDDEVASWADSVGTDRAMTLYPLPA